MDTIKEFYKSFDQISYEIGMIECFCEMVHRNVKPLALSPALSIESYQIIEKVSEEIVKKYNIRSYLEKELISTDLAPDDYVKDKYVVLYYKEDEVIKDYLDLKKRIDCLLSKDSYNDEERKMASLEFKRILGYPNAASYHQY